MQNAEHPKSKAASRTLAERLAPPEITLGKLSPFVPPNYACFHGVWGKATWWSGRQTELWVSVRPEGTADVWQIIEKKPGHPSEVWVRNLHNIPLSNAFVIPGPEVDNTYEFRWFVLYGISRDKAGKIVSKTALHKLNLPN